MRWRAFLKLIMYIDVEIITASAYHPKQDKKASQESKPRENPVRRTVHIREKLITHKISYLVEFAVQNCFRVCRCTFYGLNCTKHF